jgi:hypothetical protein
LTAISASRSATASGERRRLFDIGFVAVLGALSVLILGGSVREAFPPGDGGLFYQICSQILSGGFHYPRTIDYNGLAVPFSYSPLGFYAVALLAGASHIDLARAMALWVMAFDFAIAPAAYFATRCILPTRTQALVAAGFLVVFPVNSAWLGMGGAMTRAPGFVFFLIACGASWKALRDGDRRATLVAIASGAAIAWIHMEFLFLYMVSLALFMLFFRRNLVRAVALGAAVGALALPWLLLAHHDVGALSNALQTRHFGRNVFPADAYVRYWGIADHGDWVPMLSLLCAVVALLYGRYEFALWMLVVIVLDTRAGVQVAHLPSALAIGWSYGKIEDALPRDAHRRMALRIALVAVLAGTLAVAQASSAFVRINDTDVSEWRWIGAHTEPSAAILTLSPRSLGEPGLDQTFEWLPVFAKRYSPITYQGLEWIDGAHFVSRSSAYYGFEATCVRRGAACVKSYARRFRLGKRPAYLYVPRHGTEYQLVANSIRADGTFALVRESSAGVLFRLPATGGPSREASP